MRRTFLASLALMVSLSFVPSANAQDGEWIPLFNGKNLDGWKLSENGKIVAKDGQIVISGPRSHLFYTDREFQDFVFETEIKTTPGSNSGIYFHTAWQEEGWPTQGHEVQVNITHRDPVKSGSLYNRVKLFDVPAKDNEWYHCRITVKGKTVRVEINDRVLYEYVQPDQVTEQPMISKGLFALQAHDPESVVYYRNLRVQPLGE